MARPTIAVIGAGLMGHGIAYRFAAAGHRVEVHDPSAEALQRLPQRIGDICALLGTDGGVVERVGAVADLPGAVADAAFVVEAAPERLDLKRAIFAELERHAPAHALFASNTSAIPISRIADGLADPSRVVGAHFWNPPHLVRLVEVVLTGEESRPAGTSFAELLRALGMHPVIVNRDVSGFIGNRLQHALKREAIAMVAAGICDAETVDDVVKLGFGARLAILGPLEQSDLVGLDLTKSIHDTLMPDLDVTPRTHPYLDDLVARGNLGMKTGRGFRQWTPEAAAAVRERLNRFLVRSAKKETED